MNRQGLLTIVLWLIAPSAAWAQYTVTLDPATARFTYFPPRHGPGLPGGVPSRYELHFGLQGSFTITELTENKGAVTEADFVLLGNDAAFENDPEARAEVESTAEQLLLTAPFHFEYGPPKDRTVFRAEIIEGEDLVLEFFRTTLVRMEGGPDLRPVDGPAYRYTYPVPEPTNLFMGFMGACCAGVWCLATRPARRREADRTAS